MLNKEAIEILKTLKEQCFKSRGSHVIGGLTSKTKDFNKALEIAIQSLTTPHHE